MTVFLEPNQRTHLCFSYCSLHEEAGTAVNKIKLQLDVNLKSAESITLLAVLSFLWIDERHAKRTIGKLLAATRDCYFSYSRVLPYPSLAKQFFLMRIEIETK